MQLRPHHGLCLLFFQGKGYSPEFVENMTRLKQALEENQPVQLTMAADPICAACPNNQAGRCTTEQKVRRYDREVLRRCDLAAGQVVTMQQLRQRIRSRILEPGCREEICGDCQWTQLCHREVPPL